MFSLYMPKKAEAYTGVIISQEVSDSEDASFEDRANFALQQLGISADVCNRLEEDMDVLWIYQLDGKSREEILDLANFGVKMMQVLDAGLARAGVKLEEDGTLTDLFEG